MLGDVAVAVHPDDERYSSLVGARVEHPFYPGRLLPIIADKELVDPAFGTGVVKITPAHDPNDFAAALRHEATLRAAGVWDRAFESVFQDDGTMRRDTVPARFAGMDRFEARSEVQTALGELGLFHGSSPNPMTLGVCSRSGDVVEPMLKPQWFVRCAPLAERALTSVRTGQIDIQPLKHVDTWTRWLEDPQDWCISRQLWWGHRIPAFRTEGSDDEDAWIVARTADHARELSRRATHPPATDSGPLRLEQDPDVLDTWFSSALLPLSAFGWPQRPVPDAMYPLSIMETGSDILFFWVARMAMLCTELSDKDLPPFRRVFLHPLLRDKQGRKMSKSLGNVIDPLHVIHGASLEQLLDDLRSGNLDPSEVKRASADLKAEFPNGIPRVRNRRLAFWPRFLSTAGTRHQRRCRTSGHGARSHKQTVECHALCPQLFGTR